MIPRVVIAGTSSGAGKTTVACGLIGALRACGLRVQGFKVGPDYIDPSHHALASARPGRNLDAFLSGPELIAPLVRHGAKGADVAVIEGVMGLFDGASGRGELASTSHVAKLLHAPVVLVLDASAMARSAAAIVHGFRAFDPDVNVAGVILNRVGSDHHELLLREAIDPLGIPVLGALRRDERIVTPERHLGLVPAGEREAGARDALGALAEAMSRYVDLDQIERLARAAPELSGETWSPEPASDPGARAGGAGARAGGAGGRITTPAGGVRIALAAGPAFSFHYQENLELLRAAGAELAPFDPLSDEALPTESDALLLAGGFPEVYGAELAANAPLRAQVAAFAASGRPVLAECGGLLYLAQELDGHAMCGALPLRARMTERLSIGYRDAVAATATPWLDAGERVRGHEFHYTQVEPTQARSAQAQPSRSAEDELAAAWTVSARGSERAEGYVRGGVQASYLHVHWAAHPQLARRFVEAARTVRVSRPPGGAHATQPDAAASAKRPVAAA
ncbi:MAG: cobyrinate a,c-diamide synthase [Solirubrobacteraceae bacterium]